MARLEDNEVDALAVSNARSEAGLVFPGAKRASQEADRTQGPVQVTEGERRKTPRQCCGRSKL